MGMSELLTVTEAAVLLKTSRVQIRKMIQNCELLAVAALQAGGVFQPKRTDFL